MRRMPTISLVLSLVFLLAGGAAAQGRTSTQMQQGSRVIEFRSDVAMSEDTLNFAPAMVLSMVPNVYNEIGLPVGQSADTTLRAFITPYLQVQGQLFGRRNHEFFQCQDNGFGMDLVDNANLIIAMLTMVVPTDDGRTILRTQVDARARRRDIANNQIDCTTTGRLEKALAALVAQRLREIPPAAP